MADDFYVYGEDLAPGLVGPFPTAAAAEAHITFCDARGDADPGRVVAGADVAALGDGILVLTPEQDVAWRAPD